jgi:hypothetical protein
MLTKVSGSNTLFSTTQIKNFINKYCSDPKFKSIDKIQDNQTGWLVIKQTNVSNVLMYNYLIDKFYTHDLIQITVAHEFDIKIFKHIDSFDQNNSLVANKLRNWVLHRIKLINLIKIPVKKILGIGGEYYLYWKLLYLMTGVKEFIGISNCQSIITDSKINVPWSKNYLVNYNNLTTYPETTKPEFIKYDLILINLSNLNLNVIEYIKKINWVTTIIITCNLSDKKFKLLADEFVITKIKYFKNIDSTIRIIELEKRPNYL